MSKSSQSGLRTIKRDFSAHSTSQSSEIEWLPTPPNVVPTAPELTRAQKRLKLIEEALKGNAALATKGKALLDPKHANNSTMSASKDAAVARQPRRLPSSWTNDDLSAPSFTSRTVSSVSHTTTVATRSLQSATKPSNPPSKITTSSSTSTAQQKVASVFLSKEQTQILNLVKDGNSVFYTGSAGTGKSVLLREIIKTLRKKHHKTPDAVAITASTGIAACNIGGVTIHSFSGIGIGVESVDDLYSKVRKNKKSTARWLRTRVLIIDEVSMVDGDLFDKLSQIASRIRKNNQPFGGIQVVVTGDFFQLPPVTKNGAVVKFAFEAGHWMETVKHTYNLTKVFRQRDEEFVNMLNEMRFGQLSIKSIMKFKSLSREIEYSDGLGATELFPRREDVDRSNSFRISRLQTDEHRYISVDGGLLRDENQKQKMLANFMAPRDLVLRVDAQVMLIKNVDDTLVNGSMGRVVRFVDPAIYGTEFDVNGAAIGEQGVIGNSTTVAGVGSAAKKGPAQGMAKAYPVVEFMTINSSSRLFLVMPEVWKVELPDGEVQVQRTQLPLILSWAMSIHKSQGQTLDRVKVDLGKVFEKGQAYVALSRATSLAGLQVLNFDPRKVNAHPKVADWSKTLETIEDTE